MQPGSLPGLRELVFSNSKCKSNYHMKINETMVSVEKKY
jgi:hypothetical protein